MDMDYVYVDCCLRTLAMVLLNSTSNLVLFLRTASRIAGLFKARITVHSRCTELDDLALDEADMMKCCNYQSLEPRIHILSMSWTQVEERFQ
jgi:hypothetical protein